MAPLTVFLAKLIGLYCVVFGLAVALQKQVMGDAAALLVRLDAGELRHTAVGGRGATRSACPGLTGAHSCPANGRERHGSALLPMPLRSA